MKNKTKHNNFNPNSNKQQQGTRVIKYVTLTCYNDKKQNSSFRKLEYKIAYNTNNTIRKPLILNNNSHKINE